MEKERVKRFPHLNVNVLKAYYPQNLDQEVSKGAKKSSKQQKKLYKAQLQREALFKDENDVDPDPVSDISDNEAPRVDLSATDGDEAEEMIEEDEEEGAELSTYPHPVEVISWKKLTKDSVLIGLPYDAAFFFKGCLQVRVLRGSVEVFGHTLRPEDTVRLYSPRGSSLLAVQAVRLSGNAAEVLSETDEGVSGDCLFVAKRLSEPWTDYVQTHMKKSWKLSLFGRDQDREVAVVGEEEDETAAVRLKDMEKIVNITVIDPAR